MPAARLRDSSGRRLRAVATPEGGPRTRKHQYLEKMRELKRKKPSKGSLKRQKIIFAAAKVFGEKGYNGTKLADIAREAGTFPGSLYYHFASRDDITREVIMASMEVIAKQVQDALSTLPSDSTFVDQLRCGIGAHLKTILSDAPWMGAYNRIINEVPENLREEQKHLAHQYAMMWHRLILRAQARGELRREIDPVAFRLLLFGSVTWSQIWYKPSGRLSPDDLADNIVEVFLWGSLNFEGEKAPLKGELMPSR